MSIINKIDTKILRVFWPRCDICRNKRKELFFIEGYGYICQKCKWKKGLINK